MRVEPLRSRRYAAPMIKILVAEGEPQTAQLIEFKLKQQGFEVLHARDGDGAINTFPRVMPDLVLLDAMMPVMDGFEVLRRVKESPVLKNIPVIMLTAKNKDKNVVAGLELGAADYIVKPFSPAELVARVRKVLVQSGAIEQP
jgi:DNA-binding response OmpR family regulator